MAAPKSRGQGGIEFMKVFRLIFVLSLLLGLTHCTFKSSQQPSILLIAVEGLGFDLVACGSEQMLSPEMSGFNIFCDEAVRFTHSFTPSTMSQSALASLLSARYPHEHQVWHNGPQFLSAQIKTVTEEAVEIGHRTAFFSGGAPIWRKSGLSQGFEVFEDNLKISFERLYRPASQNINLFLSWIDREVQSSPFFSVVYLADLQFSEISTVSSTGQARERSLLGQLTEVSESLVQLKMEMERRRIWDKTTILLVGLNGISTITRPQELRAINLHSEATKVATFIKPSQKRRDLGLEWKIDRNISLVDVGATLYDLLDAVVPKPRERILEVVSLTPTLNKPQVSWDPDRTILIESGWAQWRGVGPTKFALRTGQFLIFYEQPLRIYNTLIDRMELSPLPEDDGLYSNLEKKALELFLNKEFAPWDQPDLSLIEKIQLGKRLWSLSQIKDEAVFVELEDLLEERPWDSQLLEWRWQWAFNKKDWDYFLNLGDQSSLALKTAAKKNSGQSISGLDLRGCEVWLDRTKAPERRPTAQECGEDGFVLLVDWVLETDSQRKLVLQEAYLRHYFNRELRNQVAKMNFLASLSWDVDINLPKGPTLEEVYLSLPENRRYATIVRNRALSRGDLYY